MDLTDIITYFADLAADHRLLLLVFLLAVGSLLGSVKVKGVSLGPAAVLFLALGASALDPRLTIPELVGIFGLALFAYIIGVTAGPSFASSIRHGGPVIAVVVGALVAAAVVVAVVGNLFGLSGAVLSGVYAGALTNTPALAAATQAWGSDAPTVGYSITYLFGVLGMIAAASIAAKTTMPRRSLVETPQEPPAPRLSQRTIRVEASGLPDLETLSQAYGGVVFSRIMTGDAPGQAGKVAIATDTLKPRPGDILSVVGPKAELQRLADDIGHPSSVALTLDRSTLDYRRAVVSNPELAGRSLGELRLYRRFGALVTRVRRGDVDLLATDDLVLQMGDRVRVVALREELPKVSAYFGDSEQKVAAFNMTGLGLGMLAGTLLGLIALPGPGGVSISLGLAGGCLVFGLWAGSRQKTGKVIWTIPHHAAATLTHLGILLFLAYAGSNSGAAFASAITTPEGLELIVVGAIATTTSALVLVLGGKYAAGVAGPRLAGVLAAAQTQPAVLAYANERTDRDPAVNLGYSLAYPVAMIVKVVLAPFVGRF
jgi:putative transport protein